MDFTERIEQCVPGSPQDRIPWREIEELLAGSGFTDMKTVQQNPDFHGEGDVYTHTQMVCQELAGDLAFHESGRRRKTELFLAALLHDLGKVKTTRQENGKWVSPNHGSTGSRMAREYLWRDCGLCGEPEKIRFRETVCALIRHHMLPMHLMNQEDIARKAREVAAIGELAGDFSWSLLITLAEADIRGRIAADIPEVLERTGLAHIAAEESACVDQPYQFADQYTKHAYLNGRNVQPEQVLFDDTWGEVILLSGLPGTGKDTWIRKNYPDMPVVSPDRIRAELRIKPDDEQGKVIQAAKEQAKSYLRQKQPFIWNATNLTRETRRKQTGLFENYGARVRIVYLEAAWQTRMERNLGRKEMVPEDTVNRMLMKTELPTPEEAQTVEWVCI